MSLLEQQLEKTQKSIKNMEEKKELYTSQFSTFEPINSEFQKSFESLTQFHESLISNSSTAVKKGLETYLNAELAHFESLNILTPEKAAVIKKYQIKLDLAQNDWKIGLEKGWKINLSEQKQRIHELPDGASNF